MNVCDRCDGRAKVHYIQVMRPGFLCEIPQWGADLCQKCRKALKSWMDPSDKKDGSA